MIRAILLLAALCVFTAAADIDDSIATLLNLQRNAKPHTRPDTRLTHHTRDCTNLNTVAEYFQFTHGQLKHLLIDAQLRYMINAKKSLCDDQIDDIQIAFDRTFQILNRISEQEAKDIVALANHLHNSPKKTCPKKDLPKKDSWRGWRTIGIIVCIIVFIALGSNHRV
jgi:hypothetical protein